MLHEDGAGGVHGIMTRQTLGLKSCECSQHLRNPHGDLILHDDMQSGVRLFAACVCTDAVMVLDNKIEAVLLIKF